ncbi:RNA polymerase sigma factor [Actinomadura montaniterrae]|uniref:RNA polymerase sigma factor n=1 Tax=Actinomadura montaniterrae TaxID=1803903 RepID=UPI0029902C21|nr:sigma-70 family RNA polymerase sigma factor [Actinomadura montaniterrae]
MTRPVPRRAADPGPAHRPPANADTAAAAAAAAFRTEWGQIVATLIRMTGDWDLAEDCAQDAFTAALRTWPRDGVPDRPGAWLTTTARNRAVDRLRRDAARAARLRRAALTAVTPDDPPGPDAPGGGAGEDGFGDDRLRLMFTCCHPALALDARVALTLRTLAGLTTAEIARAFLVSEPAMSKRLTRAKHKIRAAGIPYRVPPPHLLPNRLGAVLAVLYLLFNEGYTPGGGPERRGLSAEAIRLARVLAALMPAEPEPRGLLALMLLHDARAATRVDATGTLVTLEHQDRARWDAAEIDEGTRILDAALHDARAAGRRAGPYLVQAAIAACHATAPDAASTDWPQIAALYDVLARLAPTPVVALNRAVAVGMAHGPRAGLALVEALERDGALDGYPLLPATRADLLRRLGRRAEAARAYRAALDLTGGDAERRYLARRLAETTAPDTAEPDPAGAG